MAGQDGYSWYRRAARPKLRNALTDAIGHFFCDVAQQSGARDGPRRSQPRIPTAFAGPVLSMLRKKGGVAMNVTCPLINRVLAWAAMKTGSLRGI